MKIGFNSLISVKWRGKIMSAALLIMCCAAGVAAESREALWLRYPSVSPDGQTIAFSFQGDIYTASVSGGQAETLTRHNAYDYMPVWSPDGKNIAFASDRYGNFDVFIIPATGGKARRLTIHSAGDYPSDFCADGKFIYFYSSRTDAANSPLFPTGALPELYRVSCDGGRPEQVFSSPALDAQVSGDGRFIVYNDQKGYEDIWRKHDHSAFARDIWLFDSQSRKHTRLTEDVADERNAVWSNDQKTVFYLSEKDGAFNVWKLDPANPSIQTQVTFFKKHPVRFLSVSRGNDLCFGYNGELYVMKGAQGEAVKISITIAMDDIANETTPLPITGSATEMAVSPGGKEVAYISRGEVFVASVEFSTNKRITNTPEQERSISFSPDGKKLLFAAETDGCWNLYEAKIVRDNEPYFFSATTIRVEPLLKSGKESFQPAYSPDGNEVAFLEERTTLKVLNLKSKLVREVLPGNKNYSYIDGDQWYSWSPDSKHFLVTFMDRGRWYGEIGLLDAAGGKAPVNLTNSGYGDDIGKWGLKGKMAYWASDRHGLRAQANRGMQADIYALFFSKDAYDRFKLSKEDYKLLKEKEEKVEKDKKEKEDADKKDKAKDDKAKDAVEPLTFDLKNIEDRITRLTVHSSDICDFILSAEGDKLYYLARFEKGYDLWEQDFRENKTKLLAKLGSPYGQLLMGKEGKELFVLANGNISKIEVESGKTEAVALNSEMNLDRKKEREHLFEHIWRQVAKKFYTTDLHGVDWSFYKNEYSRFLPHIENNWDFAEMLSEMLGELNASHTGCSYNPSYENPDATAELGLLFDPDYKGEGLRVLEVIAKGPLDRADSAVKQGTVITKINGEWITAGMNYYGLLNRQANKRVLLGLLDPIIKKEWEEVVRPISAGSLGRLLYDRWVAQRRLETEKLSKGRLGYVHVQSMGDSSFRVVYSEALGRYSDKEGLVVDTRFNGGGNLHDDLAVFLNGKKYLEYTPRGQKIAEQPIQRWIRKSIVIMNEGNYSDAHMFPYAYKVLGVGKLVGMPVPGTGTSVWWESLQDSSLVFGIPQIGYLTNDGKYLENNQVEPDIKVNNDPNNVAQGQDLQLEAAVKELLNDIDGDKTKK